MIDFDNFLLSIKDTELEDWIKILPQQLAANFNTERYGDLAGWLEALENLPEVSTDTVELSKEVSLSSLTPISTEDQQQIDASLRALIPWRKGPYTIHDIHIDTEWRSDWKWDRVLPHIDDLTDRTILDVGCGNGYHCWRMLGAGAKRVIGIDPSPRFIVQFRMLKHFIGEAAVDVLPLGIEDLPDNLQAFDTTFSMGVLYHRRSPMDHLRELKATLKPGGQLVLETLVIAGELGCTLVPEGRYAKMNNVWFLPSCETLVSWMKKCGYKNIKVVDLGTTTTEEQRATEWMTFHSLAEFLDPNDSTLTAEGHPAPMRAVIVANT
jgi:tRNA (mo5U34)-methyltransferase